MREEKKVILKSDLRMLKNKFKCQLIQTQYIFFRFSIREELI